MPNKVVMPNRRKKIKIQYFGYLLTSLMLIAWAQDAAGA